MSPAELGRSLEAVLSSGLPHTERIAGAMALVSEALRNRGLELTVVGGSALELLAPGVYASSDVDVVVEGGEATAIAELLDSAGFERRGRSWVFGELFLDIVGRHMPDPVESLAVGSVSIRVIRREVALADRIIGFKWWRYTQYGLQAIELLRALGDTLDRDLLRQRVTEQQAEDALMRLETLASSPEALTEARLRDELDALHKRGDA